MKNLFINITLVVSIIFLFNGCTQKTVPEPALIKEFKDKKEQASENQTFIYIIRANKMLGAARITDVGCNDFQYALTTGSYALCKSNVDINTISLNMQHYPYFYKKIDQYAGKTVFIYIDGGVNIIDNDLGMTMVMDAEEKKITYEVEIDKKTNELTGKKIPKYDYGHQMALLNPFLVDIDILKYENNISNLDNSKSRIIFFRFDDNLLPKISIWSEDKLIGAISNEEYIAVDVEPGLHSFFTKYGAWGLIDINAKSGETYYVDVDNILGWSEIYTKLKPTKEIPELSKFKRVIVDESKITPLIQKRLDAALPYIKEISKNKDSSTIYDYSKIK